MGTIGGLGTYFALMFKTAFAIIGIGAYAAIFWNVPVKTIAIIATLFFMGLNLVGAKKTSALQKVFVTFIIAILAVFIIDIRRRHCKTCKYFSTAHFYVY